MHRFFFVFLVLVSLSGCIKNPETGKSDFILLSSSQEMSLGADGYKEVLSKEKLYKDPAANALLNQVGRRIAAQTHFKDEYHWEFKIIESDQVNAWCMPGGKVAFYTGIYPYFKNEAQLATVMGHEVAHATLRHSAQRISQQMMIGLGLSAASISLSDSQHHDQLMGLLGAGATVGVILPYGRADESEADKYGLQYMAKAGYDPREAVEFWKVFGASGKGAPPEFLSTHPSGTTRIRELQAMLPQAMQLYEAAPQKFGKGKIF